MPVINYTSKLKTFKKSLELMQEFKNAPDNLQWRSYRYDGKYLCMDVKFYDWLGEDELIEIINKLKVKKYKKKILEYYLNENGHYGDNYLWDIQMDICGYYFEDYLERVNDIEKKCEHYSANSEIGFTGKGGGWLYFMTYDRFENIITDLTDDFKQFVESWNDDTEGLFDEFLEQIVDDWDYFSDINFDALFTLAMINGFAKDVETLITDANYYNFFATVKQCINIAKDFNNHFKTYLYSQMEYQIEKFVEDIKEQKKLAA